MSRIHLLGVACAALVVGLTLFATAAVASRTTPPPAGIDYAKTLVVDDNGAQCANAQYTDIQQAVNDDAAAPVALRKPITVCPGTYSPVDVPVGLDDLLIKSTTHWGATILADTGADVVEIEGDNVTLQNFTVSGPGSSGCGSINAGIFVKSGATGAVIKNNHVTHIRDEPFSGCQNGIGILVGRASLGQTGTATISGNTIDDYQKGGIVVSNTGSSGTVTGNKVFGAGATDVTAQNGIQVSSGATGSVRNNTVYGNIYTPQTVVAVGILLFSPGDGLVVKNNTLAHASLPSNDIGIYAIQSNGIEIRDNHANISSWDGIDLDTVDGGLVSGNATNGNSELGVGLFATTNSTVSSNIANKNGTVDKPGAGFYAYSDTSDNTFSNNSAKTNYPNDCQDDSTGAGTSGTANTWTGNTGTTSSPTGLCSASPRNGAAKAKPFHPRKVSPARG